MNYRNILIPRPTNAVFLPVKRDWRIERDVLLIKKKSLTEEDKGICFLSDDAAFLDHNYCHLLPNDKGTQTGFPCEDLEVLTRKIDALKEENAELKSKLSNKKQLKRELFVDNVLKDDESVKFFTDIPSLACFMMIFNLLKPFAEKLKYWDKNKEKEVSYQKDSSKKSLESKYY